MSADLPSPIMDWTNPDRSTSLKEFKQMCDLWFAIRDIKPEQQKNYILLWSGTEGLRRYNTWGLTQEQEKNPDIIWQRFSASEQPENFRIHRLELRQLCQEENESVDDFITRCHTKIGKCKFNGDAAKEERMIEQIIAGIRYPDAQRKLLTSNENLTIKDAIAICKSHEASITHMKQINKLTPANTSVNEVRQQRETRTCGKCGRHHGPRNCPAYGSKCEICSKIGHWKTVCRYAAKSASTNKKQSKPRSQSRSRGRRHDAVREEETDDSQEENVYHLQFNTVESTDSRTEVYANVEIKLGKIPAKLKTKVDTGAQGNILPLRIFRQMFPDKLNRDGLPIQGATTERSTQLIAYNGTRIEQHGSVSLPCQYEQSGWHEEEFFVTSGDGPAIIGLPSCRRLKLVTLHCQIEETETMNKETLKKIYPDRFEGIGEFEGNLSLSLKEDAKPKIHPPRKYPIQLLPEITEEINKMKELGVIEKVTGPTDWVNSLAFSRKSSGGLRVCLDPKDLNKAIKRTYHKTPTLQEITNKLSGATHFSKLDARHGYWSIRLDEESSLMTTFNSPIGRYKFLRLPFGLNISQDIFQQKMDEILAECPGTLGISDDTVVYGKSEEDHDRNLKNIMNKAREHGLVFNYEKCQIKSKEISFFGMIYSASGVRPDPKKCEDIKNLPSPKNVTELQQFLGMVQYMSPFIPKLADNTAALRNLTKKDSDFVWNDSHEQAFKNIKDMVCHTTSLAYFDVTKETIIKVDASQQGIGAALTQDGKPIAFASKAMTETEQRYANIERELLAVVYGCERFHTYVFGKKFIVETDHKPLEQIQKKSLANTPPRLQRMMLRLQHYDVEIIYKPGKEMALPDMLSRLKPSTADHKAIDLEQSIYAVQFSSDRLEQLKQETEKDTELMALKEYIVKGWPEEASKLPKPMRQHWSCRDELTVEEGIILKGEKVFIPKTLKPYILEKLHEGHQGIEKSRLRARSCIFWNGMNKDIEEYVRSCTTCQRHQRSQPAETLMQHEVPKEKWKKVGTDIFQFDGGDHIIVADYFSKFPYVRRIANAHQATSQGVTTYLRQLFSELGIPDIVFSDNGTPYASAEFKRFREEYGFVHDMSSPKYPRSNGFIERSIQTVKQVLTKAKESRSDPYLALLCLRTTPIDHNLPSPAEILFGRKIRANLPFVSPKISNKTNRIRKALQDRQKTQKAYHDRNAHDLPRINSGENILMQKDNGGPWIPARTLRHAEQPRSYIVETQDGGVYRRNRRHLRKRHVRWADQENTIDLTSDLPPDTEEHEETPIVNQQQNPVDDGLRRTRSGRLIVSPDRLSL